MGSAIHLNKIIHEFLGGRLVKCYPFLQFRGQMVTVMNITRAGV